MSSSSIIDIYFQLGAKKSEREIPIREKLALVAAKNLFDDDDYFVMVTRACHHEAIFSKSLAWVFFLLPFYV